VFDNRSTDDLAIIHCGNEPDKEPTLSIIDAKCDFPMSPFYLRIGGLLRDTIIQSAIAAADALSSELPYIHELAASEADLESVLEAALRGLTSPPAKLTKRREGVLFGKLVTKVDFGFMRDDADVLKPVVIDVNDLHGGLQWIDDFRQYYKNISDDALLTSPEHSIIDRFVHEYIAAYRELRGQLPERVLIVLSHPGRWKSDNGYNYKCIAKECARQLIIAGCEAEVRITYLEQYIEGLKSMERGKPIFRLLDDAGRSATIEKYQPTREMAHLLRLKFSSAGSSLRNSPSLKTSIFELSSTSDSSADSRMLSAYRVTC
jgi:hypothetical protein